MGYPQILLKNRQPDRIATIEEYRASGGYRALEKTLGRLSYEEVRGKIQDAVLLGRGGAAFPMGIKLQTVAEDAPHPRYL
ncbi:MAG: NADH-quinone oxidoreductase subunit F, partial [Desulfobacterales bacterium]